MMKLENTYLIRKWREYIGPEDERLRLEDAKLCRTCLSVLIAGMAVLIVFDYQYNQILWVRNISDTPVYLSGLGFAMFALLFAVSVISMCVQARKGYVDTHRFAQTDVFPGGYFALISAISAATTAVLIGIMRCAIELTLVNASEVYWAANFCVGAIFGFVIFAATWLLFYGMFRWAKSSRLKAEKELDD